ncbi:hypothetical protein HJC23_008039 [Cyclotella cryptica]|uniref:homoserine dehydrogenase n=1 Tax=Cyclotella cryptica TaxID=29204 RepID=A0ABD3Q2T5_9STRA|eukprot:CCRYP_009175-RA/>CCRYP_009175-RA protein AED:0.00 eAED:0.00 QI:175/-1/1/1/-1/1/1/87/451
MREISIVLLGFGSANQAFVEMMLNKSETFQHRRCICISNCSNETQWIPWRIVSIVTGRHGKVCIPNTGTTENAFWCEVNAEEAMQRIKSGGMLDDSLLVETDGITCCRVKDRFDSTIYLGEKNSAPQHQGLSPDETSTQQTIEMLKALGSTNAANIVVEAIPSNPRSEGGGEPAVSFIQTSLEAGMHVVSANKGPLAQQTSSHDEFTQEVYWNLQQIASNNKVRYLHESAVMDGVPIFSLWKHTLPNAILTKIRGCLNSTSTMILTRMEGRDGETFEEALRAAKEMGIVERDESLDLDGYDAAVKLRALLVVFSSLHTSEGVKIVVPSIEDIPRDSIRSITREDVQQAYADGAKKYRLVATAELVDASKSNAPCSRNLAVDDSNRIQLWNAKVQLEAVSHADPIYNLTGTSSSVQFHTDVLGPITMVSTDPSLVDTAYGLFSDVVRIASYS